MSEPRELVVAAAQMGPVARQESRAQVVERLVALLGQAHRRGAQLVIFPELALTTFFPRWWEQDQEVVDAWFEAELPGPEIKPLFDEAARLRLAFCLGYAELTPSGHHYNSYLLVGPDGATVANFRKVHIPGHDQDEPWRRFQHLERRYFEPGPAAFGVWDLLGARVGLMLCNDRRWPESYRVMGLQGAEVICCGYNTPLHYAPDPSQDVLAGFHNQLVMQAGAYQNGTWVVAAAKGGVEEGVPSLAQSCIIAPSGQLVAQAYTEGDECVVAVCDLAWCQRYKATVFDFGKYRRPELYGLICQSGPTATGSSPGSGESSPDEEATHGQQGSATL